MDQDNSTDFIIQVPTQTLAGGAADMSARLQTWEWRTRLRTGIKRLGIDFSKTRFIEPWALAHYTAYGLQMRSQWSVEVQAILDMSNPCNAYVSQMGLAHVLRTGESTPHWDHSSQNTGLHVIRDHNDVTRFVESASNLKLLGYGDLMDALQYCMVEIGRNVVQHSYSTIGGVAIAQYFPDRKAIQIAIVDCGKGVMAALKPMYPEIQNDQESLKLAILPHVSGAFLKGSYSASDNAGLGLFFAKEICSRSGGGFWIVSSTALLGVQRSDVNPNGRVYRKIQTWNGTAVTMDIPASGVGDFSTTLADCRKLADDARKSPGQSGLDFLALVPDVDGLTTVNVGNFREDVNAAARVRDEKILPAIKAGEMLVLDFGGARFVTQSFVHALLHDVFRIPGSLFRLSFVNCSASSQEAIRAVAAYAASYSICVDRKRRPKPRRGSG